MKYQLTVVDAVKAGDVEDIKEALSLGIDPNLLNAEDHNTPILHTALVEGRCEIARLLVDHGADPNRLTG